MTADPIIDHLEAVVALGERMAHDARGLIAERKQATSWLVQLSVDVGDDLTPPLPGAVRVDDTERDGEMVPTWQTRGDAAMADDERGLWEWQAVDREQDIDWLDLGLNPERTYLVRRKAEVQ